MMMMMMMMMMRRRRSRMSSALGWSWYPLSGFAIHKWKVLHGRLLIVVNPCYRKKTVPPSLAPASKRSKLLESCPWVSCLYLRSIFIHIIILSVIRKIIAIIIIKILPLTQLPVLAVHFIQNIHIFYHQEEHHSLPLIYYVVVIYLSLRSSPLSSSWLNGPWPSPGPLLSSSSWWSSLSAST